MNTKVRVTAYLLILVAIGAIGCATVNVQLTPKDTASWMNSIYNAQYADYMSWFVKDAQGNYTLKPNVPEAQKQVLVKKKAIFTELHPLLITYSEYVKTGVAPTGTIIGDVEARAVKLVNDLIAQGGK